MGKEIITLGDIQLEKNIFHQHKIPISVDDVNINKIIVPNNVSFSKNVFKCFIRYRYNERVVFLCVMVPKISGYINKKT